MQIRTSKYNIFPTFSLYIILFFSIIYSNKCNASNKKFTTQVGTKQTVSQYCDKYAEEARNQMRKYKIPASITLAQGIIESGYGSSYLAVVANNHFGIKAYRDWNGPIVRIDDDAKKEPFRKYKSVLDSYEDHSLFLVKNQRYSALFNYDIRDYESWAKGLKKAGYATNPKYADILIKMIETNHLDRFDVLGKNAFLGTPHVVYLSSAKKGLKYIRLRSSDDLSLIAQEFDVSVRSLRKWNDLHKKSVLMEGDIIYLQSKRSKALKQYPQHTVQPGESMHTISQIYGVTVKSIMKRNKLVSATVQVGQVLKLR